MRQFRLLDHFANEGNIVQLKSNDPDALASLALVREGDRLNISVSIGSLELALRLRYDEMQRQLDVITPLPGYTTTRHIGSGQAYVEVGMTQDGGLILRPTLISDATGHLTVNLVTTKETFDLLREWLKDHA